MILEIVTLYITHFSNSYFIDIFKFVDVLCIEKGGCGKREKAMIEEE